MTAKHNPVSQSVSRPDENAILEYEWDSGSYQCGVFYFSGLGFYYYLLCIRVEEQPKRRANAVQIFCTNPVSSIVFDNHLAPCIIKFRLLLHIVAKSCTASALLFLDIADGVLVLETAFRVHFSVHIISLDKESSEEC